MADIKQGGLGDCYFLASIANLANYPSLIFRMFKTKEINDEGYFEIILHIDGEEQIVIVDDFLPVDKKTSKPVFSLPNGNEIWVMILEKAWAKVNGGYVNIIGGVPHEALECLAGFGSVTFCTENSDRQDIDAYYEEIAYAIKEADKQNCLISCGTSSTDKKYEKVGLVDGHAYTLIEAVEITTNGKKVDLFKIRNPWSQGEWNGDWSDKSKLWGDSEKKQVNFSNKDDGIFYMCYKDFFKYFVTIEICPILYGATSYVYKVEGEENVNNGSVFNVEVKEKSLLSVSVLRKSWRVNRTLKNKVIPSHISIVKYDASAKNRNKIFSGYVGGFNGTENCNVNKKCDAGTYLVYVYQDQSHLDFSYNKEYSVKITSSAKDYKCSQMKSDSRDKGFPLLQNLILQAEFEDDEFDPDSGEDYNVNDNEFKSNGIGYAIYYFATPGIYLDYSGDPSNLKNYYMLSPYTSKSFHRAVPAGKFLVLLGIMKGCSGTYCFNCFVKAYTTNKKLQQEFDDNEIDFTDYISFDKSVDNKNAKVKKTMTVERAKTEFYFESGDGKVELTTKANLEKKYPKEMKLLLELPESSNESSLKWAIIKEEYVTYIGQVNENKEKEGRGVLVNPKNAFVGQFTENKQNGIGAICDLEGNKKLALKFQNGANKGKIELEEYESICQQSKAKTETTTTKKTETKDNTKTDNTKKTETKDNTKTDNTKKTETKDNTKTDNTKKEEKKTETVKEENKTEKKTETTTDNKKAESNKNDTEAKKIDTNKSKQVVDSNKNRNPGRNNNRRNKGTRNRKQNVAIPHYGLDNVALSCSCSIF